MSSFHAKPLLNKRKNPISEAKNRLNKNFPPVCSRRLFCLFCCPFVQVDSVLCPLASISIILFSHTHLKYRKRVRGCVCRCVRKREREREREIAFGEDRRRTRWCLSIFYYKLVHLETERAKEREIVCE